MGLHWHCPGLGGGALTVDDRCGQDGRHASLLGQKLDVAVGGGWVRGLRGLLCGVAGGIVGLSHEERAQQSTCGHRLGEPAPEGFICRGEVPVTAGPAARLTTTTTLGRPPSHPSDPSGPPHLDKGFEAGSGGWGQGQGVAGPGSQLLLPASSAAILPPWGNWVVPRPPCPVPKQEGLKGSPHCCPFPREGGAWDALRALGEL